MTNYFSSDLTLTELTSMVLQRLHEPITGSEAVSIDLVEDTINAVYFDVFNDPTMKQSARENDASFNVAPDTTINNDSGVSAGATELDLTDATNFQDSGKVILHGDIATYTGKSSNQLTGVTGVDLAHEDGETVRQMYLLTDLASDIDGEQIQYMEIDGIPQVPMGYENLISKLQYFPNAYAIYKGYLILSRASVSTGGQTSKALMTYTQTVTKLTDSGDKPSLIPNGLRIPLLVYGACLRIAAQDAYRVSWDWWKDEYEAALKKYIALKNNRIKDRNNKTRPAIYRRFTN